MWFVRTAISVLVALILVTTPACKSKDTPNVEKRGAVQSTGTVQAQMPSATTATTDATGSVAATGTPPPTGSTGTTPGQTKPSAPTIWPTKLGQFARVVNSPIWYPKTLPAGWKLDSVDVIELDKGTGLVANIIFLKGDKGLVLTQGSPKQRSYDIVSAGRVPWGSETADVIHQDPSDPSSPVIIVYNKGGNFAELQGDPSAEELKAIAKGMVLVR